MASIVEQRVERPQNGLLLVSGGVKLFDTLRIGKYLRSRLFSIGTKFADY